MRQCILLQASYRESFVRIDWNILARAARAAERLGDHALARVSSIVSSIVSSAWPLGDHTPTEPVTMGQAKVEQYCVSQTPGAGVANERHG